LTEYTNSGAYGQILARPTWPQAPSLGFLTVNSLANQTIGFSKHPCSLPQLWSAK